MKRGFCASSPSFSRRQTGIKTISHYNATIIWLPFLHQKLPQIKPLTASFASTLDAGIFTDNQFYTFISTCSHKIRPITDRVGQVPTEWVIGRFKTRQVELGRYPQTLQQRVLGHDDFGPLMMPFDLLSVTQFGDR